MGWTEGSRIGVSGGISEPISARIKTVSVVLRPPPRHRHCPPPRRRARSQARRANSTLVSPRAPRRIGWCDTEQVGLGIRLQRVES
ncbi:hypothetical protein BCR35DRAFT_303096 [Leucosporidium creatinivorum]|uniref:G-patch domain-containing protein n=1 Tax=Leucosporidium creatinivorum TaxID=106004 RepID=A0A1Y2FLA0_9BASI|nr:hypothetical protein BCR35DRAFT_303096 [Leucosporidium creatinivorum]